MTDLCLRPLRRAEASTYLFERHGIQRRPATLAKLAVIGGGPIFRRAGRVPLYSPADLDEFAASITSVPVQSTSDLQNQGTTGTKGQRRFTNSNTDSNQLRLAQSTEKPGEV